MTGELDGKIALVTGGAAGIGAAIARALALRGAQVAVVDVQDVAVTMEPAARSRIRAWRGDVRSTSDVERICAEARDAFGPISILVNNAGGCGDSRCTGIEDLSDDAWEAVLALNLGGTIRFTRTLVPAMKEAGWGRIINTGSSLMHGLFGGVGTAPALLPYATAKSGLTGLTRQLAYDLGPFGITVNTIVPGLTLPDPEAKITKRFHALPADEQARLTASIPAGRLGVGDDLANAACFLASPASSYLTGQMMSVTGGA